jgi:hypothetical protein
MGRKSSFVKRQSYSCNRPWRPIGLWDVEAPTFLKNNRLINGGVYILKALGCAILQMTSWLPEILSYKMHNDILSIMYNVFLAVYDDPQHRHCIKSKKIHYQNILNTLFETGHISIQWRKFRPEFHENWAVGSKFDRGTQMHQYLYFFCLYRNSCNISIFYVPIALSELTKAC